MCGIPCFVNKETGGWWAISVYEASIKDSSSATTRTTTAISRGSMVVIFPVSVRCGHLPGHPSRRPLKIRHLYAVQLLNKWFSVEWLLTSEVISLSLTSCKPFHSHTVIKGTEPHWQFDSKFLVFTCIGVVEFVFLMYVAWHNYCIAIWVCVYGLFVYMCVMFVWLFAVCLSHICCCYVQ